MRSSLLLYSVIAFCLIGSAHAECGADISPQGGQSSVAGASRSLSPASQTMGKILEAFNSRDKQFQETVIDEYMTSSLRRKMGGTDNIIKRWEQTINTHGQMLLDSIVRETPVSISFWVRGAISRSWFRIELDVETDPPYEATTWKLFQGVRPNYAKSRSSVRTEADLPATIREYFSALSSNDMFSGTVLVGNEDSVIVSGAYGYANKAAGRRNVLATPFNMASAGKMFTAVLIGMLVDEKLISLDDTVGKYVRQLPPSLVDAITVRQLLNHTAGVESDIFGPEYDREKDTVASVNGFLRFVTDEKPAGVPGAKHQYSNGGFVLLGAVIEAATGKDFYAAVAEKLFAPLKMDHTGYFLKNDPAIALGYTPRETDAPGAYAWGARRENTSILGLRGSPAGGCYSTVEDLYSFMKALRSGRLLSKATLGEFTKNGIVVFRENDFVNEYGYGFQITRINASRSYGHRGGAPGASARVEYYPDLGYYIVVLSNYDTAANTAGDYLRDLLVP